MRHNRQTTDAAPTTDNRRRAVTTITDLLARAVQYRRRASLASAAADLNMRTRYVVRHREVINQVRDLRTGGQS
jgi:ribosomal protein S2